MTVESIACEQCGKPRAASVPVCPFCGHRTGGPASPAGTSPVKAAVPTLKKPLELLPPIEMSGADPTAGMGLHQPGTCPVCGQPSVAAPLNIVAIESLGFQGLRLGKSREEMRVSTSSAPGMCEAHQAEVTRGRLLATGALMLASVVLASFIGFQGIGMVGLLLMALHWSSLLRGGRYSWADTLVYGRRLAGVVERWVPAANEASNRMWVRVTFPLSIGHATARLILCVVVTSAVFAARTR